MPRWTFNNVEFDFDPVDADTAERYEEAAAAFERDSLSFTRPDDEKLSVTIRRYCQLHFSLFDYLFGEGAADTIFKGVCNVRLCDEAYESLIDFVYECGTTLNKERTSFLAKYAPRTGRKKQ